MKHRNVIERLEALVHGHIDAVERARRALAKAMRSGDASRLEDCVRKLLVLGEELEKVVQELDEKLGSDALDPDARERVELLLFFLYEVGLVEEESFWRRLCTASERIGATHLVGTARYVVSRRESLRREVLELLEKVKSFARDS